MMTLVDMWFKPPIFTGDEEKTNQARLMNTLGSYFTLALIVYAVVFIPLFAKRRIESWAVILMVLMLYGIARYFMFRGRLAFARQFMIVTGLVVCAGMVIVGGGITSPMMTVVVAITIVIGLLFRSHAANVFLIVILLGGLGLALFQESGGVPPQVFSYSPISEWFFIAVALFFMNRAMNLAMRHLENARAHEREQNAARQRAETALSVSEEKFSILFQKAPFIAVLTRATDGIIVDVNETFEKMCGYTKQEAIGKTTFELGLNRDAERRTRNIAQVRAEGKVRDLDMILYTKSGQAMAVWANVDWVTIGGQEYILNTAQDMTERKRAEQVLRESEEKFSKIFYASPMPMSITRVSDGHFVDVNDSYLARLGYTRDELIGRTSLEASLWADYDERAEMMRLMREHGSLRNFEARFRTKAGETGTALLSRETFEIAGEKYFIGTTLDITERKQAEEALRESEAFNQSVITNSPIGISVRSRTGQLVSANAAWKKIWAIPESVLLEDTTHERKTLAFNARDNYLQPFQTELRRVYEQGGYLHLPELKPTDTRPGAAEWVSQHFYAIQDAQGQVDRVVILTEDITARKRMEEALRIESERFQRLMQSNIVGISITDLSGRFYTANDYYLNLLGVTRQKFDEGKVNWVDFTPPEWLWTDEKAIRELHERGACEPFEKEYVRADGKRVWVQLANAMLPGPGEQIVGFIQDITDRKRAEEALRTERELALQVMDTMGDGLTITNRARRFVYVNSAYARMLGRAPEAIVGNQPSDFTDPADVPVLDQAHAKREQAEANIYETRLVHADGSTIPAQIVAVPRWVSGNLDGAIAVVHDLRETRRAEEILRHNEERFRALTENSSDVTFIITPQGEITYATPSVVRHMGYTPAQLVGQLFYPFLHPDDIANVQQAVAFRILHPDSVPGVIESRIRHQDGTWHNWESIGSNLLEHPAVNGIIVNSREITERKRTEEALRESEDKFKYVFDHSIVGKSLTLISGEVNANKAFCDMLGYTQLEFQNKKWQEVTHPDDIELTQRNIDQLISGEQKSARFVKRFLHKNGSVVWADLSSSLRLDKDGKPLYLMTAVVDITERKRAEEALQASERVARQTAEQLQMVNQIGIAVSNGLDLERLCQTLYEQCQRIGDTDTFIVAVYDEATDTINFPFNHKDGKRAPLPSRRMAENPGMTGHIIQKRQTVYVPILQNELSKYNPVQQTGTPVQSFVGVPLIVNERVVGVLSMQSNAPNAYTPEQVHTLELMATQTAIAIQNARLHDQVRLESERYEALARRLVNVQEEERQDIARELHDEIGQMLTGLKLLLAAHSPASIERMATNMQRAHELVSYLMERVRHLSLDLRPAMLDDLGLLPALVWHEERYTADTQVRVTLEHDGIEGRRFPSEVETTAYRIVQEGLTNVARYSGVVRARVRVRAEQVMLRVEVYDQGKGFDTASVLGRGVTSGLTGMRERVALLHGTLTIDSTPGAGTHIIAELPLAKPE